MLAAGNRRGSEGMGSDRNGTLGVGIGGLGAIGLPVARWLADGPPGLRLAAISARDRSRAAERLAAEGIAVPVVGLSELAERAEVVIECVPAAVFDEITRPAVAAGRILLVL